MKETMTPPGTKTISVKCSSFWEDEFEIDPKIFDDVHLEAATRAVERRKNLPGFTVAMLIECWEKQHVDDPMKHICYNTYFVMINAGMHVKAEIMRHNFFQEHKVDLRKQSLKPDENNG